MYLSINKLLKTNDIQEYFTLLSKKMSRKERLIINCKSYFLTMTKERNWLEIADIKTFLELSDFEVISVINSHIIARKKMHNKHNYHVSIIIPAKNEAGNIAQIVKSIPKFGKSQEIIFVEGGSSDATWEEIKKLKKVKSYKQLGKGKADAVRLGISKAKGEVMIIYDSDRTVDARDLKKFYIVLSSGLGEFANGSRLVYPMEKDAMRTLNIIGNKFFSMAFSMIFAQRFKDTLCGTKAFFRSDYQKFKLFKSDPFGDFQLIFGAIENNLKVTEVPVRYKERVYGATNIKRFYHGLLLLKVTIIAIWKFRVKKSFLPRNIR